MATHSSVLAWRIPMDRGAWWATVRGVVKESDKIERLSTAHPVFQRWIEEPGEDSYSCFLFLLLLISRRHSSRIILWN